MFNRSACWIGSPATYLSQPPAKLCEDLSNVVFAKAAQTKDWLERRETDEEDRDLVTELDLARGWEVDAAIIVVQKDNKTSENAVMRAVGHVVILKNF